MAVHNCFTVTSLSGFVKQVKASVGRGCPDGTSSSSMPEMRENKEYNVTRPLLCSAVIWRVICQAYLSSSHVREGMEGGFSEPFFWEDCFTNLIGARVGALLAFLGRGFGPSIPTEASLFAMMGCHVRSPCSESEATGSKSLLVISGVGGL